MPECLVGKCADIAYARPRVCMASRAYDNNIFDADPSPGSDEFDLSASLRPSLPLVPRSGQTVHGVDGVGVSRSRTRTDRRRRVEMINGDKLRKSILTRPLSTGERTNQLKGPVPLRNVTLLMRCCTTAPKCDDLLVVSFCGVCRPCQSVSGAPGCHFPAF